MNIFEVATQVCELFERLEIPYVIGGSVASITWGEMRTTNDVDIAVGFSEESYHAFKLALPSEYYLDPQDPSEIFDAPRPFQSAQLMQMDEVYKLDLFILPRDEYRDAQFARARQVQISSGPPVKICSPEDTVIMKLRWYELGNRVSDRQWNDIVQVLEVQKGKLDETYMIRWTEHFNVIEMLRTAQSEVSP